MWGMEDTHSAATAQVQRATSNSDAVLLGVFGHIELDNSKRQALNLIPLSSNF
jgi:hypothetical protein